MKKLIFLLALLMPFPVLADDVQIVYVEVEKQIVSEPVKMPVQPLHEYEWDQELIDEIASIYWAETGANNSRTAQEKLAITQLIYNRSVYGKPFPDDLLGVCKQNGEFNHGRISDRNRRIARENLNKVKSQADGFYQGIDPNLTMAIYMTREGGSGILTFQDSSWVTVWRVEG